MAITLTPITTHVNVSTPLYLRLVFHVIDIHIAAAIAFPHAMSFLLAAIFSHQYKQLDRIFEQQLAVYDEPRRWESEIETLKQRHQDITNTVTVADNFLKFSNAAAFCCELVAIILTLYSLIFFYPAMNDTITIMMYTNWMIVQIFGLFITAAGGIMVNYYVSTNAYSLLSGVIM